MDIEKILEDKLRSDEDENYDGALKTQPLLLYQNEYRVGDFSLPPMDSTGFYPFINRLVLLFGSTRSGKTMLVRSLLSEIHEQGIPIMLLAPHNSLKMILPSIAYHNTSTDTLNENLLTIIKMQEERKDKFQKYSRNKKLVAELVEKYNLSKMFEDNLHKFDEDFSKRTGLPSNGGERYQEELWSNLSLFFRTYLRENYAKIKDRNEQQKFLDIGNIPFLILVLDDLGDCSKVYELNQLAIKLTHYNISLFHITHVPSMVSKTFRNNADFIFIDSAATLKAFMNISNPIGTSSRELDFYQHFLTNKSSSLDKKYLFLVYIKLPDDNFNEVPFMYIGAKRSVSGNYYYWCAFSKKNRNTDNLTLDEKLKRIIKNYEGQLKTWHGIQYRFRK